MGYFLEFFLRSVLDYIARSAGTVGKIANKPIGRSAMRFTRLFHAGRILLLLLLLFHFFPFFFFLHFTSWVSFSFSLTVIIFLAVNGRRCWFWLVVFFSFDDGGTVWSLLEMFLSLTAISEAWKTRAHSINIPDRFQYICRHSLIRVAFNVSWPPRPPLARFDGIISIMAAQFEFLAVFSLCSFEWNYIPRNLFGTLALILTVNRTLMGSVV